MAYTVDLRMRADLLGIAVTQAAILDETRVLAEFCR